MKALVPLDGSENSLRIFDTVRRLLALQPAIEIHTVEILDHRIVKGRNEYAIGEVPASAVGQMSVSTPMPRLVESHGEAMDRIAGMKTNELKDFATREIPEAASFAHIAWSEHPAEAINSLADELEADVIVMATHGRSGFSHLLVGSVTEAVIRSSRRPVLVQGPASVPST